MGQLSVFLMSATLMINSLFGKDTAINQFAYQHELDNMSCPASSSVFTHGNIKSLIQCLAICRLVDSCEGVAFNSRSRLCRGCNNLKILVSEYGARIYNRDLCINERLPNDPHVKAALSIIKSTPSLCATKILQVTNGFRMGEWFNPEFCPTGTFTVGYNMRIESKQSSWNDDTSLNTIKLHCKSPDRNLQGGTITSQEGQWGDWKHGVECPQPMVLKSFQFSVEKESSDNTAVNFVRFRCGTLESNHSLDDLEVYPGYGYWGDFGAWSEQCNVGHGVCGLRTKVHLSGRGSSDDTSLNDMVVYCCKP